MGYQDIYDVFGERIRLVPERRVRFQVGSMDRTRAYYARLRREIADAEDQIEAENAAHHARLAATEALP